MAYQTIKISDVSVRENDGVVILTLEKWKKIQDMLEDLEMYRSVKLMEEISKRRKEKKTIPLEQLLKKYV